MNDDRDSKNMDDMPIKRKKKPHFPAMPTDMPPVKVYEIPPMSDAERIHAENKRIADAFALVEEKQREYQDRKAECWEQIVSVAARYGFELAATHQPVHIIVDLQPLQERS